MTDPAAERLLRDIFSNDHEETPVTADTDLCTWSDLPTTMCDHCHPGPRAHQPRTGAHAHAEILLEAAEQLAGRRMRVVHPIAYQEPAPHKPAIVLVDEIPDNLHDFVTELIDPTIHTTRRQIPQHNTDGSTTWITINHRTTSVSLLDQLDSAVTTTGAEDGGARAFASKPAARLDTLDALTRIEKGTYDRLTMLGITDPMTDYPELDDAIRHLRARAANEHHCSRQHGRRDKKTDQWCCDFHDIEADVRSWWARARVLSGWDSPAWKPDNTCPLCGIKGGLRVKLEAQSAVCCECGETWGPDRLGLLVEHVRLENREDEIEEAG